MMIIKPIIDKKNPLEAYMRNYTARGIRNIRRIIQARKKELSEDLSVNKNSLDKLPDCN